MRSYYLSILSVFLLLICSSLVMGQSNVGIGTLNPDASALLELSSSSKGLLIPRMSTTQRNNITDPAKGLLVYDSFTRSFWYWAGDQWKEITENTLVKKGNIIHNSGDLNEEILVFGSDALPSISNMDTLLFFHTPSGAFRSGIAENGTWSLDSLGYCSFASGRDNKASGRYSSALGQGTRSESLRNVALGSFNIGGGDPNSWNFADPIFEVGNGLSHNQRSNALTILKNGYVGIGTSSPDTYLSVVGNARVAATEAEVNYIEMGHGGNNAYINNAGAGDLVFRNEGINKMVLTSNGRVGIGTSSPNTDFSVVGKVRSSINSSETEYTELFHGGDNGFINTVGDGNLDFRHDNNTLMSLTDSGDLSLDGVIQLGATSATPMEGMVRYNTTFKDFEGYNGTSWNGLGNDADSDPGNELQTLFISGNNIGISQGNQVPLPSVSGGTFIESNSGDAGVFTDRTYVGEDIVEVDINSSPSFRFYENFGATSLAFLDPNVIISNGAGVGINGGTSNIAVANATQATSIQGDSNIVVGNVDIGGFTGDHNIMIGNRIAGASANKNRNVIIGHQAGQSFAGNSIVAIGQSAGAGAGGLSVYIGNGTGTSSSGDWSLGGAIGYLGVTTASSQYVIGNVTTQEIGGYEPWSNLSDGRFKENIQENVPGLSFINKLRPVTYTIDGVKFEQFIRGIDAYENLDPSYKEELLDLENHRESGFIAQEVEASAQDLGYEFDGIKKPQNDGDPYALAYSQFVVPLVKSVQELSQENQTLRTALENKEAEINSILQRLDKIEKQLLKE